MKLIRWLMKKLSSYQFFTMTQNGKNAVSYKIIVPYASITRSAYGQIREDDFDIVIRKTDGASITDISQDDMLAAELLNLQMKNRSGVWADYLIGESIGSSEMMEGLSLRIRKINKNNDEDENPLPDTYTDIEELYIPVIQEQATPFPRTDDWSSTNIYKNGHYLVDEGLAYIWSHWQSGNSSVSPKLDVENNPLTTHWKQYGILEAMFTKIGIIGTGLVGSAVFRDQFMMSQYGIDSNGDATNDYPDFTPGGVDFNPNILLDFLTGKAKFKDADIEGVVRAKVLYSTSKGLNFNSGYTLDPTTDGTNIIVNGGNLSPTLNLPDPTLWPGLQLRIYTVIPASRISTSIKLQSSVKFSFDGLTSMQDAYYKYYTPQGFTILTSINDCWHKIGRAHV